MMEQEPMSNPYIPEPYIQMIHFADGTEIAGSAAETFDGGDLWVWPSGDMSFIEALNMFGNPDKTVEMTVDYSKYESKKFTGYTKVTAIENNPAGKLSIRLNRQ